MGTLITPGDVFDLLLPRVCSHCGKKLQRKEEVVCFPCFHLMKELDQERLNHEYNRKFLSEGAVSGLYSLYLFENESPIRNIIHSLKYSMAYRNGLFLGKLLGKAICGKLHQQAISTIIPVPLHPLKKAERGYNQSYYIATGVASVTGLCLNNRVLKRHRFTESQTTMTLIERQKNTLDAFSVNKGNTIQNKNILLIDDVITTGATISECARVLIRNGAEKVYAASTAIAE